MHYFEGDASGRPSGELCLRPLSLQASRGARRPPARLIPAAPLWQADPTSRSVYVGNISPEVQEGDLRAALASYGNVISLRLRRREGFGFVDYGSHSEAVHSIVGAYLD